MYYIDEATGERVYTLKVGPREAAAAAGSPANATCP